MNETKFHIPLALLDIEVCTQFLSQSEFCYIVHPKLNYMYMSLVYFCCQLYITEYTAECFLIFFLICSIFFLISKIMDFYQYKSRPGTCYTCSRINFLMQFKLTGSIF